MKNFLCCFLSFLNVKFECYCERIRCDSCIFTRRFRSSGVSNFPQKIVKCKFLSPFISLATWSISPADDATFFPVQKRKRREKMFTNYLLSSVFWIANCRAIISRFPNKTFFLSLLLVFLCFPSRQRRARLSQNRIFVSARIAANEAWSEMDQFLLCYHRDLDNVKGQGWDGNSAVNCDKWSAHARFLIKASRRFAKSSSSLSTSICFCFVLSKINRAWCASRDVVDWRAAFHNRKRKLNWTIFCFLLSQLIFLCFCCFRCFCLLLFVVAVSIFIYWAMFSAAPDAMLMTITEKYFMFSFVSCLVKAEIIIVIIRSLWTNSLRLTPSPRTHVYPVYIRARCQFSPLLLLDFWLFSASVVFCPFSVRREFFDDSDVRASDGSGESSFYSHSFCVYYKLWMW